MKLLAPNYAYISSGGSSRNIDGSRPLLITSRATCTTSLVMLDPHEALLFAKQPDEPQECDKIAEQMEKSDTKEQEVSEKGEKLDCNYMQVSTEQYTVAFVPLSEDYAVQVMPSAVRLVQLTAEPVLKMGKAYQKVLELSALRCGASQRVDHGTSVEEDEDEVMKAYNDEEDKVSWDFDEEESDEEGDVVNKSTDRKKRRAEAVLEFQRVEAELHLRRADRASAKDSALYQAAVVAQVDTSSAWTVTHTASLGPYVALFGGETLCILGLDYSVDEEVASAAPP